MKTAVTLADHVYVIGHGMLVEHGTPRELLRGEGVKGSLEMSFRKQRESVRGTSAFRHMYEMQCGNDEMLQKIDCNLAGERNNGHDKKGDAKKEDKEGEVGEDKSMPLPSITSGKRRGSTTRPARRLSLSHMQQAKRRQSMKVLNMLSTEQEKKKDSAIAESSERLKPLGRTGSAAMMMASFKIRKGASFKVGARDRDGVTRGSGGSVEKKLRRPTKVRGSFMAFMLPQNPADALTKELEEEELAAQSEVENSYDGALEAVKTIDAVVAGEDDWVLSGDALQENDSLRAELVQLRAALAKHVAKSDVDISQKLASARSEGSSKALLELSDIVLREE